MSRVSKWKLEKTKVKVVFRLQFHATHIPQSGWDKLFISFIPADSGKPTAKTTKANVRNGNCKWADPIYETTRLLQDSRSKQYDDKLYQIAVAMGSSRASTLGEATINLANFVDALKPSAITLPLHGCNFGTVLHITVQLLTSKTGFREFEQQRELREKGLQSGGDGYCHSGPRRASNSDEVTSDQTDKVSKLKADASEFSTLQEEANTNEEYADSATGFDGSSNTSGSFYAEKHDSSSTHENDSLKSATPVDLAKEDPSNHQSPAQGPSGPAQGWSSDSSIGAELAIACEENNRLRGSLESAELSVFNLKLEVSSLQTLADELGAETEKFSHQLSADVAAAEELAKEVTVMKSECSKFKDDINRIKDLKISPPQISRAESSDNREIKLQFLNGISVVEGKIRELQKKVYVDGDTKFIFLELEALLDFLLNFKRGNGEMTELPLKREEDVKEIRELGPFNDEPFTSGNGLGLDLCEPESFGMGLPVSEVVNTQGAIEAMKGQIFDLVTELDESKVEKEGLIRKMNHMECYYEALIQELEENQKRLVGELQHLRNEHSACLYALSVSQNEIESLRENMNQQILRFSEEKHELEATNEVLERRATTSEAALRRARLNYSIAVDKLQKDLELLSSQVLSMFETNENLIKQALPSQQQNSEDDDVTNASSQFEKQNMCVRKRSLGGDVLFEDLKRSFLMQEELYQKVQEELIEMYSINLNLDIYSKALEQCLRGARADVSIMEGRMGELLEELELSTASQNRLMVRLQKGSDEIHTLNEFNLSSISQNQILEEKLAIISEENYCLNQKIKDLESEIRSYESKYGACLAENAELSLRLKREALENENLTNESSDLRENLKIVQAESDELASSKNKLEENIKFMQEKLVNLLFSYTERFSLLDNSNLESVDIKDNILELEEIQRNACVQNRQLMEENRNLKSEKADAEVSLSVARSEILTMKQKFKSGVLDMVKKLNVSNALVDKLEAELESMAEKMRLNSEIEEKFVQQNRLLLADFTFLEDKIQELTCKNGLLGQEISGLDSLAEELGRGKLVISELLHDKQELALYLREKTEESVKLLCENSCLKEKLETLRNELHYEKACKDELEEKIRDLTVCLSKNRDKLIEFEEQKSNLEIDKSRLKSEKADADASLSVVRSEILTMKQKFESGLRDTVTKLNVSNALVDKLEAELESVAEKQQLNSEIEEKFVQKNRVLLADLALLGDQMQELALHVEEKTEETVKLSCENSSLKEKLETLRGELLDEKAYKDELEEKIWDLTVCLSKNQEKLLEFEGQKDKLMHVRELASDLEIEKSRLVHLLGQQNEVIEKLEKNRSYRVSLESQLLEMHDYSLALDVRFIYVSNQYKALLEELLAGRDGGEADWRQEKSHLLVNIESLRSDLEASGAEKKLLSDSKIEIGDRLEECKKKLSMMETRFSTEVERLRNRMINAEEDVDHLTLSKEILVILLKGKVDEQTFSIMILRSQIDELSRKLAEQALKTEEFKNLSIHLKGLKDKAEAAREKRENEVPSATVQDSLRIAFIKEQCETKVQELKQQLSISKKHGEEMLLKLQDAIDEIENRKKSEAMSLKRNEELSVRLSALELELMGAISEKREKGNAYDRVKAELECAVLSLECCKEEKERIGACLVEFEAEKSRLVSELALVKGELESLKSVVNFEKDECLNGLSGNSSPLSLKHDELTCVKREICVSTLDGKNGDSSEGVSILDGESADMIQDAALFPQSNGKNLHVDSEHLGAERLRSSIEHLHEELERMKNENAVFSTGHDVDSRFQDTQSEIMQLHKANEELRSMCPSFDEISSSGNALNRVLALEIELAEALKTKNKSTIQFQSSFLKQHTDEEAVFRSFRDINELVKEMLELKGRQAGVEVELREMHDRYSQLSLRFAEVEGERQKLKMTLKKVRASKKMVSVRSSLDGVMDTPS